MFTALLTAVFGTIPNGNDRKIIAYELSKHIDKNTQELSKLMYEKITCDSINISVGFDYNNDGYPKIRTLIYDVIITYPHRHADIFNVTYKIKNSDIIDVQIESGESDDGLY